MNQCVEITREKSEVINIDGKTIRGSANKEHGAYHVVSAWLTENQITLGEIKTEEKANEITAVPALLDMFDVEGSIVTADAMSCQRAITEKIGSVNEKRENKTSFMNHISQGCAHLDQKIFLWRNKNASSVRFSENAIFRGFLKILSTLKNTSTCHSLS